MTELRKDKSLQRLGMDPIAPGRGAITGRGGKSVWDFLSLTDRPKERSFTNYPHLTLGVHADRLKVAVTIPNGVVRAVRKRLIDLDVKELIELNRANVEKGMPDPGAGWLDPGVCGAKALSQPAFAGNRRRQDGLQA